METIIRPIWNKKAVNMSGYNLFVKTNLPVFDEFGEIQDFSQLQVSIGDLMLPNNVAVADDAGVEGGIAITWADNSGVGNAQATDKLNVLAICEGSVSVLEGINITRDTQAAHIVLPFGAGVEAQVYVFFKNEENGTFSVSKHGVVNVT